MTQLISVEYEQDVAILKLRRSVTNPLDLELVIALEDALQQARRDDGVHALVLGSESEKFFSIGFDIPHLFDLEQEQFADFYQAFNRLCLNLYTLPKPSVAALGGHAIAGGCILALCCDYRLIAEGRKLMGLNEVKLGVPVPYPADRILHSLVGEERARQVIEGGDFYPAADLLRMGLVDMVTPLESVLPEAIHLANTLGAAPLEANALIKHNRVGQVEAAILASLDEHETHFVECWYSPEARTRLQEAMEKF